MTDTQETLFGTFYALDSRGAIAMVDALNEALDYSRIRGGNHPGKFLRFIHSKGFKIEPCEPIPLDDKADTTEEKQREPSLHGD